MVTFLFIAFLAQATAMFLVELKDRSIFFLIWPILTIFTALPIFREYILSSDFFVNDLVFAMFVAVFFNTFYMACYFLTRDLSRQRVAGGGAIYRTEYAVSNPIYILIGTIFFLVGTLALGGFSALEIASSTWKDKGELGFLAVLILYGIAILSGFTCKMLDDNRYILALLALFAIAAVVILFRTRSLIAMSALSLIIYLITVRRVSITWMIPAFVIIFVLSVALRAVRFMGSLDNVTWQGVQHNMGVAFADIFENGDLSIFRVYLAVIDRCEVTISCFDFTYLRALARLVGFEPALRFEYLLYDHLVQAGQGGSLHPTAYGIAYGDFGLIGGAMFFSFLPLFHLFINRYVFAGRFYLMLGFVAPYLIFLPRGSIYNSASLLVAGVFVSYFLRARFSPGRLSEGEALARSRY